MADKKDDFTTLDCIAANCPAIIARIATTDLSFAQRLNALGLVDGAKVTVVQAAPFGGPLSIRVHDSTVSLRRNEASQIAVAEVS